MFRHSIREFGGRFGNIVFGMCGHGMEVGRVNRCERVTGGMRWRAIRSGSTGSWRGSKRCVNWRRVQFEIHSQWRVASMYSDRRLGGGMGWGGMWGRGGWIIGRLR